jgi:hypothetical protein
MSSRPEGRAGGGGVVTSLSAGCRLAAPMDGDRAEHVADEAGVPDTGKLAKLLCRRPIEGVGMGPILCWDRGLPQGESCGLSLIRGGETTGRLAGPSLIGKYQPIGILADEAHPACQVLQSGGGHPVPGSRSKNHQNAVPCAEAAAHGCQR